MNNCENCKAAFSLEEGGFIWDKLVFCQFCDPKEGN